MSSRFLELVFFLLKSNKIVMITKAQVKHIRSLEDKKYRYKCNEFVVEGEKMVQELVNSSLTINCIYATKDWIEKNQMLKNIHMEEVEAYELEKMSSLSTPNMALATVKIPTNPTLSPTGISLVLDRIQDPGNLGSIVRIADWFGINNVYCSEDTVDVFNNKVVQASMGSVFRIKTQYVNIEELLNTNKGIPSYVAILNGEDIASHKSLQKGFIIIGNESKGVSNSIINLSTHKISIQRKGQAESLNAAIAAGIICHSLLS
jgi:TrmH family RNA methyltransferase